MEKSKLVLDQTESKVSEDISTFNSSFIERLSQPLFDCQSIEPTSTSRTCHDPGRLGTHVITTGGVFESVVSKLINAFQCPNNGYFAKPNDKHSFYHCAHGTAYVMPCPAGLVWNQQIQVCDWDTNIPVINCDNGGQHNCRENSQWSTKGISIVGSDNKFGSDSKHLGSPFGLFVDTKHDNIYVADTDNHRIQKFNLKALETGGITVAGGNGAGNRSNQLSMPRAVYVDRNENIYIADDDNHRIQLWSKGATSGITVAGGHGKGKGLNQIGACQGIYVHEDTNSLFISDFYNDRIVKWNSETDEGIIIAGNGIGGSKANQLSGPRGIFIDECETIYIADLWNSRIQKWKKDASEGITVAGGHGKGSAANQLNSPWDVEVDQYNNIYVVDTDNNRIQKWSPDAISGVTVAGGNGWGDGIGQFKSAHSIGLDKQGNMYVSEQRNHRIQRFNITAETNSC
ncbi:unnamed protein product [Rotaria sordida]|uniref:Chitin-binding type-2 domain-containing protein n=1 Tax=Rotaria sordida TaxID=392033 RepID=A0A814C2T1_9BILA|nr:unnamed protein product [Rotaria sordida]